MLEISKASAGSGKTYKLAFEYIKLVLGYDKDGVPTLYRSFGINNHGKILAITFTNKATEEMKQRIVKQLFMLASGRKCEYLQGLMDYYKATEADIRKCADNTLRGMLNNFTNFNVSTIDSFFQIVLRTFIKEANSSVGSDYGIELKDNDIVKLSTMEIIANMGKTKNTSVLQDYIYTLIKSKIDSASNWNIFLDSSSKFNNGSLFSLAGELTNELVKENKDALNKFLNSPQNIRNYNSYLDNIIDNCHKNKKNAAENFTTICPNLKNDLKANSSISNHINRLRDPNNTDFELKDTFWNNYKNPEKSFKKDAINNISDSTIANLANELSKIIAEDIIENTATLIKKNLYTLGLFGDIARNMDKYREDNNVILLSDTNKLLEKIIGEDDAPFIYERIGMRLQNLLIDEFQDTSRSQWTNMKPLLHESLGSGHYDLIIGDVKQSIYRFRNADSSLLHSEVANDYHSNFRNGSLIIQGESNRSTNFRSCENIIKFNNTLFCLLKDIIKGHYPTDPVSNFYNNVVQDVADFHKDSGGYIELKFITESDKNGNNNNDDDSDELTESGKIRLERTVDTVHDILKRGYEQSDIAVLVNKNNEGAKVIDTLLNATFDDYFKPLNIISDDSLLLKNSPAVGQIISILEYLDCVTFSQVTVNNKPDKNNNNCNVKEQVKSKKRNLPTILQHFNQNLAIDKTPSEALENALFEEEKGGESALEDILKNLNFMSASLTVIVDKIIQVFITSDSVLQQETPFITAFQDVVLDFSNRNTPTIHSFLKWWKISSANLSISVPPTDDAIKVMTIHKSKGLEFKFVIIPFADWDISKAKGPCWFKIPEQIYCDMQPPIVPINIDKSITNSFFAEQYAVELKNATLDNLNKTYVALTRAVKELYIFSKYKESKTKSTSVPVSLDKFLYEAVNSINDSSLSDNDLYLSINKGKSTDEDMLYSYGEKTNAANEDIKKEDNNSDNAIWNTSSENFEKYQPGEMPSDIRYCFPELDSVAIKKGDMYHRVFSTIEYEDEVEKKVDYCILKGWIHSSFRDELINNINSMISQKDANIWFKKGNKVITERSMHSKNNNYRCDRMIITPDNQTIVIDYKFGDKRDKKYHTQISKYIEILKESGFDNVIGKIWYPSDGIIETIK